LKKNAVARPKPHFVSGERMAKGKTRKRDCCEPDKVSSGTAADKPFKTEVKIKIKKMVRFQAMRDGEDKRWDASGQGL